MVVSYMYALKTRVLIKLPTALCKLAVKNLPNPNFQTMPYKNNNNLAYCIRVSEILPWHKN